MKVFISYAHHDKEFAHKVANSLKEHRVEVWIDALELKGGDNLFEKINHGVETSDLVVVVLSKAYSNSRWVMQELSAFAMKEIAAGRSTIIPILMEECEIPIVLQDRVFIDFRGSFEEGLKQLLAAIRPHKRTKSKSKETKEISREIKESAVDFQLATIREQYKNGNLTLFCGAGISLGAGVPTWTLLLKSLLSNLFNKRIIDKFSTPDLQDKLAQIYQENFTPSPLMIAQYLKNGLGSDFTDSVRDTLYQNNPQSSPLIDAIVELARPQRSRQSLHSVITFNFDDLIEQNLGKNKIRFRSIYKEGQRCGPTELPIYHAHGFLPHAAQLSSDYQVVFSEDAYHSQFIDSFSWSNLIQLNHLNQNLCLFVGLSMTDPNLRRLLDVSMRKNPDRALNHYVFKKRYDRAPISTQLSKLGVKDNDNVYSEDFIKMVELLEEQDANNLGLNVIWVDDYPEIAMVLKRLLELEP